jgi:hypothetical protein
MCSQHGKKNKETNQKTNSERARQGNSSSGDEDRAANQNLESTTRKINDRSNHGSSNRRIGYGNPSHRRGCEFNSQRTRDQEKLEKIHKALRHAGFVECADGAWRALEAVSAKGMIWSN